MSDPRIATVAAVLREDGVLTANNDTDTVATRIVNALDREHGAPAAVAAEVAAEGEAGAGAELTGSAGTTNPETPVNELTGGALTDPAQ